MNPDIPNPREELEAKLTALLLGELSAEEAFALGRAIEQDAELAKLYGRLKDTVGFLRETVADPADKASVQSTPLKLSDERREKLLANLKTVRPKELAGTQERRTSWFVPLAAAAMVMLLAAIALPNFVKSRATSQSSAIRNNLRQLDGAKQQWAIENRKSENDEPSMNDLKPYLKNGLPSVAGEKYVVGNVGEPVAANLKSSQVRNWPGEIGNTQLVPGTRGKRIRLTEGGQVASVDKNSLLESGRVQASSRVADVRNQDASDFGLALTPSKPAPSTIALPSAPKPAEGLLAGEPGWIGVLEKPSEAHSATNRFVSRYAYPGESKSDVSDTTPAPLAPGEARGGALPYAPPVSEVTAAVPAIELATVTALAPLTSSTDGKERFGSAGGQGGRVDRVPEQLTEQEAFRRRYGLEQSGQAGSALVQTKRGSAVALPQAPVEPMTGLPPVETSQKTIDEISKFQIGQNVAALKPSQPLTETRDTGIVGKPFVERDQLAAYSPGPVLQKDEKVPMLGDVPLSGKFFRGEAKSAENSAKRADNRAFGFDWYLGNELVRKQSGTTQTENITGSPSNQSFFYFDVGAARSKDASSNVYSLDTVGFVNGVAANSSAAVAKPEVKSAEPAPRVGQKPGDAVALKTVPARTLRLPVSPDADKPAADPVIKGKELYEMGRLDEAATKLKQAVQDDPQNNAARYYLNLASEARYKEAQKNREISSRQGLVEVENAWAMPPRGESSHPAIALPQAPSAGAQNSERIPKQTELAKAETSRAYLDAERKLEDLQRSKSLLDATIAAEKIDATIPKTSMVELVDLAQPAEQSPGLLEKIRGTVSGGAHSTARVKIERDQTDISGMAETPSYDPYLIQSELEVIQSEKILGKVADDLRLSEAWAKKKGEGTKLSKEETLNLLKKKLDLKPVRNTSLIEIGAKSDNPQEAANIANAVAKAYKDHRLEQRLAMSRGGVATLEDRFKKQEQEIQEAEKKVNHLREALQTPDVLVNADGPAALMSAETLRKVESLRLEKKVELERQKKSLENLKQLTPDQLVQALPRVTQDPQINSLSERLTVAEQDLARKSNVYGPERSEVANAARRVNDLNEEIKKRATGLMAALEDKLSSETRSLQSLDEEILGANRNERDEENKRRPIADSAAPIPQPEVATGVNPYSTFSLNVSDVSFKLAAASLEKSQMPDAASVRSEEFINAFDYRDPEPVAGVPVAFAWERARYPFAHDRDLLRFSIKTAAAGRQAGRPLNIVLLLDNSGSMERADRVRIIREALRVLATQLQPQDRLSVVTFARTARLFVDGVAGDQAEKVAEEVSGLTPQGGTNLEEAMNLAYQTAARHYLPNGINRVVLLTDGAANLGDVAPESLKQKVEVQRKQGIALDCFGIGWEGFNDDLLEILSRNGDGRYGFINTPEEAATEFAGQLAGALHVAASDVKVQIEFNPDRVTAYRQIGYAKHQLTKEQFRDNTVDAAEIGAAESGNALYVIETNPAGQGPLATVRVRFKVPGTSDYREHEWAVPFTGNAAALEQASPTMRLAATASAFSEWLVSSPYAGEVTADRLLGYLSGVPDVYGADARPKKLEWMIRQAKSVVGSSNR